MNPDIGSNIIAVVQLVFTFALLPTLNEPSAQVPRSTSAITALGLWIITAVYLWLHLGTASCAAGVSALAWSMIFAFRPVRKT